MAFYEVEGHVRGESVEGCFGSAGPYLWTWSGTESWDLARIQGETLGFDPTHGLRYLEDATEFDVPTFSAEFISGSACLRTPASMWAQ